MPIPTTGAPPCCPNSQACSAIARLDPSISARRTGETIPTAAVPMAVTWSPRVWTTYGHAIREPHGLVHWAGTETSGVWNGKMDGALLAGERAAAEVLEGLG